MIACTTIQSTVLRLFTFTQTFLDMHVAVSQIDYEQFTLTCMATHRQHDY